VIKRKDPSDYTGLEYTISTQMDDQKVEWFPDNGPKEESGEMESLMTSIKEKMGKINEDLNKFIDKNGEEIKTCTKAIQKAIENVPAVREEEPVVPNEDEPAPLEI
jgi:hypothetical protein